MNTKIITRTALAAVAAAGLFAAVVSTQLYNTVKQATAARDLAIEQWLVINPDGTDAVSSYRALCEGGPTSRAIRAQKPQPQTFAECSAQVGSVTLAEAIEQASATVVAPAPLRWM